MKLMKFGLTAASVGLGLGFFATMPKPSNASLIQPLYWEEHYRHEYKVRVKRPTKVYKVTYGKYTYKNRWSFYKYLHRGEVVRTWYAGVGGFGWHLTGGAHGRYDGNSHHAFDVEWTHRSSFKILKVYYGYNWF